MDARINKLYQSMNTIHDIELEQGRLSFLLHVAHSPIIPDARRVKLKNAYATFTNAVDLLS